MSRTLLGDLLATLFERSGRVRSGPGAKSIAELCRALQSERGELSGQRLAQDALAVYAGLDDDGKRGFFRMLTDDMDIAPETVITAAHAYADNRDPKSLAQLLAAAEPPRQELLRRLNQAPGATGALVQMRADLLHLCRDAPDLKRTDLDFVHLFSSWFNRGFLVLRQIDWSSPASILEKIIAYEAVHAINSWSDLRRRLEPPDRRCFAFFHPAMPDEPLIFVEVALVEGIPGSVQALLQDGTRPLAAENTQTAVFYSISNCQKGLQGISFGNSLIKQVVEVLQRELPQLRTFVTLSPVPGLAGWLQSKADDGCTAAQSILDARDGDGATRASHAASLRALTAHYLVNIKRADGRPADPVARFHLGNGAQLADAHAEADVSASGLARSCGAMVNYLYDLSAVETQLESFASDGTVAASRGIRALAISGAKLAAATEPRQAKSAPDNRAPPPPAPAENSDSKGVTPRRRPGKTTAPGKA